LPLNLCAKGYFTDTGNSGYRAAGESESLFYRDLAGNIGTRTLQSVYADLDPDTRHGVVITEDIAATGATFVDPRSPRSPAEVAASLEQCAAMHGRTWNAASVSQAEWLAPRIATSLRVRGVADIRAQFDGPMGAGVPHEVRFGLCCGIVYGLFLWSITQKVKAEITTALLGRLGTAAADHDVYRVVRPPSP
jgi:hypothetical protein